MVIVVHRTHNLSEGRLYSKIDTFIPILCNELTPLQLVPTIEAYQ